MEGTRQWIIDQIHTWLNDFQAPNILWLGGSPGAGKSTIASTLVSQLAELGRLGSSFFGDVALSDPADGFLRLVSSRSRFCREIDDQLEGSEG
jgi:pantothenate kinase-related protein Tda10